MKAVLKIVAALLAVVLIAVLGTLSFVKSRQASESSQRLRQALTRVTEQKGEIDSLKAQIEDLHEKMREIQAKLKEAGGPGASGPAEAGSCPAAPAPVAVEVPEGARTPLGIRYVSGVLKVLNTGASLRIAAASGGRLQIGAEMFDLRFIHLVRPEGGLLNGRPVALAAHLVHSTASGETVVVSVALRESAFQNRTIWLILNNLPAPDTPEATIANIAIDPNQLLPDNRGYELFRGSLPFQPCTGNVRFYQFSNPVGVSKDQVERFLSRVKAPAARGTSAGTGAPATASQGGATGAAAPAAAPRRTQP